MFLASLRPKLECHSFSSFFPGNTILSRPSKTRSSLNFLPSRSVKQSAICCLEKSDLDSDPNFNHNLNATPKKSRTRVKKTEIRRDGDEGSQSIFPATIPKKPRRGRKSEASAVEDLVRSTLERTFETIREQNPDILKDKETVIKYRAEKDSDDDDISEVDDDDNGDTSKNKMVVEEEDPDWPLDADVGWGIRASEYFDQHPIKNVVGGDGVEIDWEGETDDNWVKEINCLEWERFAFHPSPLIVLVFERYNRASENWKVLKELEKAVQVYLGTKHLLPPRTVKIDINIERDLAYALKVKDCPQIMFLRGHKILYREQEMRTADELVQMIAHFYFNAKKPPCIKESNLSPPF